MGREKRRFEWEKILQKKLWCATELAPILQISPLNTRRYLRRAYYAGRLYRKQFGKVYYYGIKLFKSKPKNVHPCPVCKSDVEHYSMKCGCSFDLCAGDDEHSVYDYCKIHEELLPLRLRKQRQREEEREEEFLASRHPKERYTSVDEQKKYPGRASKNNRTPVGEFEEV
jgi:hypothetical protein